MSIKEEAETLRKKLEEEKKNPIKIALFGQPGAGKSSSINRLIASGVAEAGVHTDTTTGVTHFEWSDGITLIDLPGYGTEKFPNETFFDKFPVLEYDLVLCVFSGKFHDADTKFFQHVRSKGKVALLVRNKSDEIWQDNKTYDELTEEIIQDARKQVKSNENIYFTSCRNNTGFDKLQEAIFANIDASKKERWARAAKAYSIEALEAKREACQTEIYTYAGLSAANALNPIPGADVAVDVGILLKLFKDIKDNYGLTDEKLQSEHVVERFGPVVNQMMQYGTKEGILILLKQFAGRETVKAVAKYIPGVGTAIAATIGFAIIKYAGNQYLEDCHKVAKGILEEELKA